MGTPDKYNILHKFIYELCRHYFDQRINRSMDTPDSVIYYNIYDPGVSMIGIYENHNFHVGISLRESCIKIIHKLG